MAVVWDFYKGIIPNILIIVGMVTGMIYLFSNCSIEEILLHVPGILFPVILLFPLYKIGTLGAGDIKLFMLPGFYFSFMETVFCIFSAFLIGAMLSFAALLWRKNLKERMLYLLYFIRDCFASGHFRYYYLEPESESKVEKKSKIHFSLPIFLSVISYIVGNYVS